MRAPTITSVLVLAVSAACGVKREPPKEAVIEAVEASPDTKSDPGIATTTGSPPGAPAPPTGPHVEIGNDPAVGCARTLCIAGHGELTDPANLDLGALCRQAPGVVRRCEDQRCMSIWSVEQWQAGLEALITSLDRNGDGVVDERDPSCRISLAGWSRGAAIVATQLPKALRDDPRTSPDRAVVEHLVAIAPYTGDETDMAIDEGVRKAWIYRHTRTPDRDCSTAWEHGPWLSPAPRCGVGTQCWDYDYSVEPMLAFLGRHGARSGSEVDHCGVVGLVAKLGLDNLALGLEARSELLPRLSNGEASGRVVHDGPAHPDPGPN